MGLALVLLGGAIALVGFIWLIVTAFQESVLWGIGCIFIPFCALIFAIMHWDFAKKPFLIGVAGNVIGLIGQGVSGAIG